MPPSFEQAGKEPRTGTRRAALLVEYDGGAFRGLQKQRHTPNTVQGEIERAACTLGVSDARFIASGRTDAGVHALGQVVAIDVPAHLAERRLSLALNALLPREVRVRRAVHCDEDFNPRLDARMRTYVYRLCSRDPVPPMLSKFVAYTVDKLEPEATIAAAASFAGEWDFSQWRSTECGGKRTVLTITEAAAFPPDDPEEGGGTIGNAGYWRFRFRARSFLHHQIRFLVGGVIAVGGGKLTLAQLQEALRQGRRPEEAKCAPPGGLCFTHVAYPAHKDPFNR